MAITRSEGFVLAVSVVILCVLIVNANRPATRTQITYTESELGRINLLAAQCRSFSTSYDNLAIRSICKDIYEDVDAKNIDKAVNDSVYLSILLDDIGDPTLDNLRVYTDAVVSSTASV